MLHFFYFREIHVLDAKKIEGHVLQNNVLKIASFRFWWVHGPRTNNWMTFSSLHKLAPLLIFGALTTLQLASSKIVVFYTM
jgi:hypothetical protein